MEGFMKTLLLFFFFFFYFPFLPSSPSPRPFPPLPYFLALPYLSFSFFFKNSFSFLCFVGYDEQDIDDRAEAQGREGWANLLLPMLEVAKIEIFSTDRSKWSGELHSISFKNYTFISVLIFF